MLSFYNVGREILFHYSGEDGEKVLTSVSVQGKEIWGGVPEKTITYETEERSYTPLREYQQDAASARRSEGIKYDYFQKREGRLVSCADFQTDRDETWQYERTDWRLSP